MAPDVNVWVRGKWYGPSYPDAGDLPAGRTSPQGASVTNTTDTVERVLTPAQTDALVEAAAKADEAVRAARVVTPALVPPPKSGPGSSRTKWATYAEQQGVTVPAGADRDDIIAALRDANVPVDQPDN